MKKIFLICILSLFSTFIFSQGHNSVPVEDPVYEILQSASGKGYIGNLYSLRPYTEKYVVSCLEEIIENLNERLETNNFKNEYTVKTELKVAEEQLNRFNHKEVKDIKLLSVRTENDLDGVPFSFTFKNDLSGFLSSGIYSQKEKSSTGYELYDSLHFFGDLTNYLSYKIDFDFGLTCMPLVQMNVNGIESYKIGSWWQDEPWLNGESWEENRETKNYEKDRAINAFRNYSVLPYTYKKFWSGSLWNLSSVDAGSMLGWAQNPSFAFDMKGDIRTSFFNEKILIGLGRQDRELAAMDNGSSLVLNRSALPFLAMDMAFRPVSWLQFTTITGILEFPNKAYLYEYDEENEPSKLRNYNREDSYMFQNAYSVEMIDLDFKFFHFDVGSACVWPKRFELGYFFPFITNVVYQNYIGDYDNLCLFGDIMLRKSGLGKIWISGYLDEMPTVNPKYLFKKTRYMFSMQGGAKWEIPFLPFANLSLRYTRVEPYCYTHDSIKNTPWYNDYISESYTNGGESLGYYLAPNSDEILVRFEMKPLSNLETALQYQLIRHGADFGSQQVQGSSLYSELVYMYGRGDKYKYFLKDGAYEWSNIITLSGSCNLNSYGIPASLNLCAGYVYDYFTDNEGDVGECSQYHKIETKEYNTTNGFVFSIGFKAFCK